MFIVGGGVLGAQSQSQLVGGLGVNTSTGGGLFGNQPRLGMGGGGLFNNASTQNKLGGGLGGTGGLFGQQQSTSQTGSLFGGNTGGGGLFNQSGIGTQLGGGLGGMQTQVSAMS